MIHSHKNADIASDEFRLISEALENLGRCHSATPWEEDLILMIRNIGRAVDADRESFVKNLIDHGFMYDRNWIRVRTMLVFTTWILYDTTRGAWEGWSANEMWEECKRQMIRYKSGKHVLAQQQGHIYKRRNPLPVLAARCAFNVISKCGLTS
jgi:hypothetical protein